MKWSQHSVSTQHKLVKSEESNKPLQGEVREGGVSAQAAVCLATVSVQQWSRDKLECEVALCLDRASSSAHVEQLSAGGNWVLQGRTFSCSAQWAHFKEFISGCNGLTLRHSQYKKKKTI